jgi:hypothetical protein
VRWDIGAEHTGLESLDVSADVRLRCKQVALVRDAVRVLVTVRHDDARIESLNLLSADILPVELTMRSVSHSVPVPFRNTSSGLSGMMLHSEKMNGLTYFM